METRYLFRQSYGSYFLVGMAVFGNRFDNHHPTANPQEESPHQSILAFNGWNHSKV